MSSPNQLGGHLLAFLAGLLIGLFIGGLLWADARAEHAKDLRAQSEWMDDLLAKMKASEAKHDARR